MKFLCSALLFTSLSAQASFSTSVLRLEPSLENPRRMSVFLGRDGRVLEVDASNAELLGKLQVALSENTRVELETEGDRILDVSVSAARNEAVLAGPADVDPLDGYVASDVGTLEKARAMFKELYQNHKWFNQCFNRAHIWAKQMFDGHGVRSEKILVYYTRRYRREFKGKWWFHIAPVVKVEGQRIVMDREFTDAPVTDAQWEAIFNKAGSTGYRCKRITNISEFYDEANQESEYCNIQHTSMYYWEPNDMERLEKTGEAKTDWVDWEIKAAAKEAFWEWRKIYKRHTVK